MVVEQLQTQPVANNGGLPNGDVGKRPCVYQHRLMLHGVAQRGVDGVPHPRRHCPSHLPVIGQHDASDPLPQVLQISCHGQYRHQLGADGDVGAGVHRIAVHFSLAQANTHFPQRLAAEVQHKAPLYPLRVDVQPPQPPLGQLLVVVVPLVLHPGVQRRHGQIVGVHDVVDVAGQPQRKLRHGNQQRVAAAGRRPLYVHGRPAGGLAQAAAHVLSQPSQSFDQSQRRGGLALTQRRGRDGRHLDVPPVRSVVQPLHNAQEIQLGCLAVGQQLLRPQSQLLPEHLHTRQSLLCRRADLPVLIHRGIEHHTPLFVLTAAISEFDFHHTTSSGIYTIRPYILCLYCYLLYMIG